jgi:hypothetical protein
MLIYDLITVAEADATLAQRPDWLALTDDEKSEHITKASVYVQTSWRCDEVEWTDLPSDIKDAVAWYAYADMQGALYPDSEAQVKKQKDELGSLKSDTEWYQRTMMLPTSEHLKFPDAIMSAYCFSNIIGGVDLVRASVQRPGCFAGGEVRSGEWH